MLTNIKRLPGWSLTSLIAVIGIAIFAPQQLPVLVFKVLQVTAGIGLAYLADKALFLNAPPIDETSHDIYGAARLFSRAIVVLAVLLALSLGI